MRLRIGLFGIYHESNTFIDRRTTIEDFANGHWLKGESILGEYKDAYHELGGMIRELERNEVEIVPISFAEATPGGIIQSQAYDQLTAELCDELTKAMPLDGCLIALHGAAVSEEFPDMDGDWLIRVRKIVGDSVRIVGTLDPHANVSIRMTAATDALISYQTNPHTDQRETGMFAAKTLLRMLNGDLQLVQHLVPSSVAISIEQQHTGTEPCRSLYKFCDTVKEEHHLYHVAINLGFPYADVEEMGTSFIVIAALDNTQAGRADEKLQTYMKVNRNSFVGIKKSIEEVLPMLHDAAKPILLLDMGDNIGGGATGNSLHIIKSLEDFGRFSFFGCLHNPAAVTQLLECDPEEWINLKLEDDAGISLSVVGRIVQFVDGKFSERSPRHGGQVNYDMGTTVILETKTGNTIMMMTNRIPPFSLQQLTAFGVEPEAFDVIIAKGVIAPIAAYSPVCKSIIQVDTPGSTQANMKNFQYKRRRRPLFPFENITG